MPRGGGYSRWITWPAAVHAGTWNTLVREVAVARMAQAGVVPITWVAAGAELPGDWRSPYAEGHGKVMSEHLPFRANPNASFQSARGG